MEPNYGGMSREQKLAEASAAYDDLVGHIAGLIVVLREESLVLAQLAGQVTTLRHELHLAVPMGFDKRHDPCHCETDGDGIPLCSSAATAQSWEVA